MDNFLSKKFNKFLEARDFDAANLIIKQAIELDYPHVLTNSWEQRLNQSENSSRHPLDSVRKPIDINYEESCKLGPNLKECFQDNLVNYYTEIGLKVKSLDMISDLIFDNLDQNNGSILLPDLTSKNPELNLIPYSVDQYISDSPDIFDAVRRGVVFSELDHFLRSGYFEILRGRRYSTIVLAHERNKYNGKVLYIVDSYDLLSKEQVERLHSLQLGKFSADIFSIANKSVYTSSDSCIDIEKYLFQNISEEHNLCILLKGRTLTIAAIKWLIDIKLKDRTAIFGYSNNKGKFNSLVEPSFSNMLITDVTNGCLIVNCIEVLSVLGRLNGYKTSFGFYHALVLAIQADGIEFKLKPEILSETINEGSFAKSAVNCYWSPFYWRMPVSNVYHSNLISIRSDLVKTWSNYSPANVRDINSKQGENKLCIDSEKLVFQLNSSSEYTIAIIIPFKDKIHLLENCVDSLMSKKEDISFKIYAINNDSQEPLTFDALKSLKVKYSDRFACIDSPGEFNYAKINNEAVNCVAEEYILFLNNDILFDSDFVLTTLLKSHLFHDAIITGAKLLYPSGKIQHNGLALSTQKHIAILSPFRGEITHLNHLELPEEVDLHPWERTHECSAVTAACMLMKKDEFIEIGGFDEELKVAYNDVDLCLRATKNNLKRPIICSTESKIFHLESESRGLDANSEKRVRLYHERTYLVDRHHYLFSEPDKFIGLNPPSDDIRRHIKTCFDRKYAEPLSTVRSDIDLTKVFSHQCFESKKRNYACIFVHYDRDSIIPSDCIYHLSKLSEYCDIYFVSSSETLATKPEEIEKTIPFCKKILVRKNSGYDFGCWSHVIREDYDELCTYEGVLLSNDSNWGPLHDFSDTFTKIRQLSGDVDFFGLTSSITPTWHLQSFFILYSRDVFSSSYFKQHWFNIGLLESKFEIIMNYEVNWCARLTRLGFEGVALYGEASANNPTHQDWDVLLRSNYPYLKKELLRDNPLMIDLDQLPEIISSYEENWASHFLEYLKRYGKDQSNLAESLRARLLQS